MADSTPSVEPETADAEAKSEVPDCPTCETFEPQAWRKSLCRNCFHALEEHSADLLAAEARAVATEAASGKRRDSSSSEPKEPPKTAPKPDMKSKAKKPSAAGAAKDTKDSPNSSTSSSSSSSSLSRSTDTTAVPKSAREKFLEKVNKSSEKSSASAKDSKSSTGAKSDKKSSELDSKTSSSSSSTSSKTSLKSSQQQSSTSSSSSSAMSKSGFSISTSESNSKSTTTSSSQKVSRLKDSTTALESKLSSSKTGANQTKSQEIRVPGASGSSLSSKLSAFTEKASGLESSKKTLESKTSPKSSSDSSKSSTASRSSLKQESEQKESNVASKFAKFGGGKSGKSPKGSAEDLRSKSLTGSQVKKDGTKNDTPSRTSSTSAKSALFEKNSPNKTGSDSSTPGSLKQTKDSPPSRPDLSKPGAQGKESNSKKDAVSSKLPSEQEKITPVGKKALGADKEESKNSSKNDGLSTRYTGSTNAKSGESTPQGEKGRWGSGGEKLNPSDTTGKNHTRSTSDDTLSSPKSSSNCVPESKESKEKGSASASARSQGTVSTGPGSNDDGNVIRKDSGDVDLRNKHSASTPTSPTSTSSSIRPGTLGIGEQQSGQASARGNTANIKKPGDISLDITAQDKIRKPGDLSLDVTANGNRSDGSVKSTPSPVKSILDSKNKFREKDLCPPKSPNVEPASPTKGDKISKHGVDGAPPKVGNDGGGKTTETDEQRKLKEELKKREEELTSVKSRLAEMEGRVKNLEAEKVKATEEEKKKEAEKLEKEQKTKEEKDAKEKRESEQQSSHKKDIDTVNEKLSELQAKLEEKESQCERLTTDNQGLKERLKTRSDEDHEKTEKEKELAVLEQDLEAAEKELEETREDNRELKRQVMEMRNEMDEMTDSFRESELEEFREMQRELEMASKNCRILQFKLRKAERRNIQTEEDRANYEEKLRQLEAQFDSQDARSHIQVLEEELRVAKEVSVRLHDELDIVEDKRLKAMEETRHLTELLEHTDKRQFRMEMEIDKLRDMVCDLKQQLKEARAGEGTTNAQDSSSDRKAPSLASIGQQGSKDYDLSQLMKDLYDSMERENDLKDQLKFSEEEAKMMRRRVSDMDEENESLRVQLQRMSEKASKHKKREKEREKQLEEERKEREALSATTIRDQGDPEDTIGVTSDVILVVGADGSDVISSDEPIPVTQRKDSTDEDLMNVMQLRIQLEMLEQELVNSHKKLDEMDLENENLVEEVKFLQGHLSAYESQGPASRDPPPEGSGGAAESYWEEKVRELAAEADDLRWKLIEREREMERMAVTRQHHSSRKQQERLKKSRSLEATPTHREGPPQVSVHTCDLDELRDLRRQLEHAQTETAQAKAALQEAEGKVLELQEELAEVKGRPQLPSVHTDDAAVENIELRAEVKRLEQASRAQSQQVKSLTETLHRLTAARDTATRLVGGDTDVTGAVNQDSASGKTNLDIPGMPSLSPAEMDGNNKPHHPPPALSASTHAQNAGTRDLSSELLALRAENLELRRLMAVWGVPGSTRAERREMGAREGGRVGEVITRGGEMGERDGGKVGDLQSREDSVSVSTTTVSESSVGAEVCKNTGADIFPSSTPGVDLDVCEVDPGLGLSLFSATPAVQGVDSSSQKEEHGKEDKHALLLHSPRTSRLSVEEELCEETYNFSQESSNARSLSNIAVEDSSFGVEASEKKECEDIIIGSEESSNTAQILEVSFSVVCDVDNISKSDDNDIRSSEQGDALKVGGDRSEFLDKEREKELKAGGEEILREKGEGETEQSLLEVREESHHEGKDLDLQRSNMEEEKQEQRSSSETESEDRPTETDSKSEENKDAKSSAKAEKRTKDSTSGKREREGHTLSILERYPRGKSRIVTSGSDSRVELMEKVLDMDDEIGDLISEVLKKEGEVEELTNQLRVLTTELKDARDECRRTELELLQELDMLQDKNSVMSNLLDIINERAEAAEEELERRVGSNPGTSASPCRAGSNVSQVSALSDTSTGSDEVFVFQYAGGKDGALTRDWEAKLKGRIESLERLLAEERQKVSTAEKKLILSGIGNVTPSVTDDVKLRLREKEILQDELITSQHHLQIATDQIKGLRERLAILEDEHARLKDDYGKLYEEVDVPKELNETSLTSTSTHDDAAADAPISPDADDKCSESGGDAEFPFVSKRISVVEAPKFRELRRLQEDEEGATEPTGDSEEQETKEKRIKPDAESTSLHEELELYKQRTRELEFQVEEINEIWKSKSDASEKDRDELQRRVNERTKSLIAFEEKLTDLKKDLTIKNKIIAEKDKTISELKKTISDKEKLISESARAIEDKEKILQERDMVIADKSKALSEKDKLIGEKNKIVSDFKSAESGREAVFEDRKRQLEKEYKDQLDTQEALIAQRESNIRNLDAAVRARDERLREKDDILQTLNTTLEEHKREMTGLGEKLTRSAASMREKDAAISVLRAQLPEASVLAHDGPSKDGGETDAEKEGYRLKAALQKAQVELRERDAERVALQQKLEESRRALEDAMVNWDKDRGVFQGEINVLEEKVRLYEMYNPRGGRESEAVDGLKKELSECFQEREVLLTELSTIRLKMDVEQRAHKGELAKLQGELTEKLKMLKAEVDNNARVSVELDRLRRQNEMGYRVQQELRVLKADTMALKVRYETRIDKMSKDHNKMLLTINQLQKERDRDRETVLAIQKNLSLVKDKYTEELLKSEEDKSILTRQRTELEESRGHLELLQRHLRELRDKTSDQERVRSDLINRFSTERASWEIERANLNSQINQLREHISCSSREEGRSKDIQVNMGLAWEKERGEQRRLLQEAHTLALDLQEQLRTRDEASAHDRKELVHQLEAERQALAKIKRDWEKRMAETESSNRKLTALQSRLTELQTGLQQDRDIWSQDKTALSRQLAEVSNAHARDVKRVEDVLSNLIRLRELGSMALPDDTRRGSDPDQQTKTCIVSQSVLDFAKEAVYQMNRAADDLTAITSPGLLDQDAVKKISASEMDLVKQEFTQARHTPKSKQNQMTLTPETPRSSQVMEDKSDNVTPTSVTPVNQQPRSESSPGEKAVISGTSTVSTTTTTTSITTSTIASTTTTSTTKPSTTNQNMSTINDKSPKAQAPSTPEKTDFKQQQKQKELQTKEQQKQHQKELKKKKEEEEQLMKKQKKKSKEGGGGGGLSGFFGRHKHAEKDVPKSSALSTPARSSAITTTTTTTTTATSSALISSSTTTITTTTTTSSSSTTAALTPRLSPEPVPSLIQRPQDSRRPERPPSYASGTRSAQGSRATTPEVPELIPTWPKKATVGQAGNPGRTYQQGNESGLNDKPVVSSSGSSSVKPKRPVSFSKSISVDSAPVGLDISPSRHHFLPTQSPASFSNDSQGRQQWTADDLTSFFSSLPSPRPPSSTRLPVISFSSAASGPSPSPSLTGSTGRDGFGLRAHSSSPNREKLSPRSARRKFFDEYPTNSSPSPSSGTPSTPTLSPASAYEDLRRSVSPSRQSVEEAEFMKSSHAYQHAQAPPPQMTTSASWDEKMHHRITHGDDTSSASTAIHPKSTHSHSGKPAELSAKQKRSFFKKSSSLDSTPVGESIAQVGVAAAPVAAPSNFAPSDFFAAVKGKLKLKPVFKRKSGGGTKDSSPTVQAQFSSEAVSSSKHESGMGAREGSASIHESESEEEHEYVSDLSPPRERSRDGGRGDKGNNPSKGKWRSKSADRVASHGGPTVHGDVIRPASGTWKFNETAV